MSKFSDKLTVYLDAAYPALGVETPEELRLITREIMPTVQKREKTQLFEWDIHSGLVDITDPDKVKPVTIKNAAGVSAGGDLGIVLAYLATVPGNAVFVLKDAHSQFTPKVVRAIRSLIPALAQPPTLDDDGKEVVPGKRQAIIFISPRLSLPHDLLKDVQMMEFPLPTQVDLLADLDGFITTSFTKDKPEPTSAERLAIVESAAGMTSIEFMNALSSCSIAQRRAVGKTLMDADFARLMFDEKVISLKNGFLEYVPTVPNFDAVGGLNRIKAWALQRRTGYEAPARAKNLPYPKGVLIGGVPGCGKTFICMAIAHAFGFPLFKLDLGRVFGSKVGESEGNVRELITLLEGLGRAVILLDECEKYLRESAVTGGGDSGTSSRVFGTLLQWMSSKTCPTFLAMTANDIECLPAALVRKGRLDELFWVDLPTASGRVEIFNALLKHKFKQDLTIPDDRNDELVQASDGFNGAELESVIEDALYSSLNTPDEPLGSLLLTSMKACTPQSKINAVHMTAMRKKAEAGYKLANDPDTVVKKRAVGRNIKND